MPSHAFEIFVDGGCRLCSKEARLLAWLDRGRGRLLITDITDPAFDPSELGVTFDDAMRSILGRTPDGAVVHGVEVFRRAYDAVGLGWLLAPTDWPLVRPIADRMYRWFARRRYERRMREGCDVPGTPATARLR
ncbi:MAG: DUF393 domain-containing protein [Phycisphaerales bacterium]